MYERSNNIFQFLIKHQNEYSIQELADLFQVSRRTIYNDLNTIDEFLIKSGFPTLIRKKDGVCYSVKRLGEQRVQDVLEALENHTISLHPEKRKNREIQFLLFQTNYITVDQIADYFMVSRNTILNDLKEIRKRLSRFNISLESVPYKGYRITGTEKDIRNAYVRLFNLDKAVHSIQDLSLKEMELANDFIDLIEKKMEVNFTDQAHFQLSLYLCLLVSRIKSGNQVESSSDDVLQSKDYEVMKEITPEVEKAFSICISEKEIRYFSKKIMESPVLMAQQDILHEKWLLINTTAHLFIKEVGKTLKKDFLEDDTLFLGLIKHLRPAYYRMMNNELLENPLYDEICKKYQTIHQAVVTHIEILEKELMIQFTEQELSFLTMFFASSLERNKGTANRVPRVILVCHAGVSTSQILYSQLKSRFRFQLAGIYSSRRVEEALTEHEVDLIVTTVPLDIGDIKTLLINPILSQNDLDVLEDELEKVDVSVDISALIGIMKRHGQIDNEAGLRNDLVNYFYDIVTEDTIKRREPMLIEVLNTNMIAAKQSIGTREEAVKKSGQILLKNDLIEERYIDAMLKNLEENGNYIVIAPGIAMPHARPEEGAKDIGLSLVTLKEPVVFGHEKNDPVQIIIGLCAIDHQTHLMALSELVNILSNQDNINAILDTDSEEEIMNIIKNGGN